MVNYCELKLIFADADANAGGSTKALPERYSGELKMWHNVLYTSVYAIFNVIEVTEVWDRGLRVQNVK